VVLVDEDDAGAVDKVLIGNEYPPASHGVRFRVEVVFADASPFFCCSAAFSFSNEVTSILTPSQMISKCQLRSLIEPSDNPHKLLVQV
jgi:hypothetical protein